MESTEVVNLDLEFVQRIVGALYLELVVERQRTAQLKAKAAQQEKAEE